MHTPIYIRKSAHIVQQWSTTRRTATAYTYFRLAGVKGFNGQGDEGMFETEVPAQGNPVPSAWGEALILRVENLSWVEHYCVQEESLGPSTYTCMWPLNLTSLKVYGVAGLMFEHMLVCAEVAGGCVRSLLVQTHCTIYNGVIPDRVVK